LNPVAIVYNTRAGKGRARSLAAELSAILGSKDIPSRSFEDDWPTDYSGYSSVWIVGGDGTLNYFINHAKQPLPPLALFKGGTGNDFATLLYGDSSASETVDIVLHSPPGNVDAGICNGQLFLNMAGLGFDGEVVNNMQTIRWMGTFAGYYFAVIKTIFLYREPSYKIIVDQYSHLDESFLLLQLANSSSTGGGFKVSPLADIADGKLNLMLCEPLSRWKRLIKLPLIRKGTHLNEPYITHQLVEKLRVDTKSPIYAQLDGELIQARHFEFAILPGYFHFLY
jgi:diacylglycerol kinase family enzyme